MVPLPGAVAAAAAAAVPAMGDIVAPSAAPPPGLDIADLLRNAEVCVCSAGGRVCVVWACLICPCPIIVEVCVRSLEGFRFVSGLVVL